MNPMPGGTRQTGQMNDSRQLQGSGKDNDVTNSMCKPCVKGSARAQPQPTGLPWEVGQRCKIADIFSRYLWNIYVNVCKFMVFKC